MIICHMGSALRRLLKIAVAAINALALCIKRSLHIGSSRLGNRFRRPKHLRSKRNRLPASIPNSRGNVHHRLFFSYRPRTFFCHYPKSVFVVLPLLEYFGKNGKVYQPSVNPMALRMVEKFTYCPALWTISVVAARSGARACCHTL